MPVTVVLSTKIYEKFGSHVANEVVDWFNKVDATYRSVLRELNELNFGRLDTKLGAFDGRFDAKLGALQSRFDAKLEVLQSRLETRMAAFEARIIKWMFVFWIGQAVTTVGLVFGVVRLTGR